DEEEPAHALHLAGYLTPVLARDVLQQGVREHHVENSVGKRQVASISLAVGVSRSQGGVRRADVQVGDIEVVATAKEHGLWRPAEVEYRHTWPEIRHLREEGEPPLSKASCRWQRTIQEQRLRHR